jgi:hypothetical protein
LSYSPNKIIILDGIYISLQLRILGSEWRLQLKNASIER